MTGPRAGDSRHGPAGVRASALLGGRGGRPPGVVVGVSHGRRAFAVAPRARTATSSSSPSTRCAAMRSDRTVARAATPNLDRLAAHGARFTFAHAHAVLTLPSHASILTGRYPYEHGIRDNSGFRLRPVRRRLRRV